MDKLKSRKFWVTAVIVPAAVAILKQLDITPEVIAYTIGPTGAAYLLGQAFVDGMKAKNGGGSGG